MAVIIRHATLADLPSVSALMHEAFIEYRSSYTDEAFAATTPASEQLAKRMDEGPIWVAVQDDVLVGTVSALPLVNRVLII